MAKKSISPKGTEPGVGIAAATKPAAKPAKGKKPAAAKAPASRTRVKASPVTKADTAPQVTPADIALRAYFIAEKRQKLGIPGDSTGDWVAAERQLKAEAAAKPKL